MNADGNIHIDRLHKPLHGYNKFRTQNCTWFSCVMQSSFNFFFFSCAKYAMILDFQETKHDSHKTTGD